MYNVCHKWSTTICDKRNRSAFSWKRTKECWNTVRIPKNGLRKSETSNKKMMRKEDVSRCKSREEIVQVFKEHFRKQYERVPIYDRSVLELLLLLFWKPWIAYRTRLLVNQDCLPKCLKLLFLITKLFNY